MTSANFLENESPDFKHLLHLDSQGFKLPAVLIRPNAERHWWPSKAARVAAVWPRVLIRPNAERHWWP